MQAHSWGENLVNIVRTSLYSATNLQWLGLILSHDDMEQVPDDDWADKQESQY